MKTKEGLYLVIGILVGIIVILVLLKIPGQPIFAVEPTNSGGGTSEGMIALTTNTSRQSTILWVLDTKKGTMLIYEFANDNAIKLKAFRDIKSDIAIPDDYAGFQVEPKQWPSEVRKAFTDVY